MVNVYTLLPVRTLLGAGQTALIRDVICSSEPYTLTASSPTPSEAPVETAVLPRATLIQYNGIAHAAGATQHAHVSVHEALYMTL